MHELGLARAIASALRTHVLDDEPISICVSGGSTQPEDFEHALLAHLACELPELSSRQIRVVFLDTERTCSACAHLFQGTPYAACPACGGPPLPSFEHEQVEVVFGREDDSACA